MSIKLNSAAAETCNILDNYINSYQIKGIINPEQIE